MRKSPIKVTLKRIKRTEGLNTHVNDYQIVSIAGAITLGAYTGETLRAGDTIPERVAERLGESYLITTSK